MTKKLLFLSIFFIGLQFTAFAQRNNCDDNAAGELTVDATTCVNQTMNSNNASDYWNGATGCGASDVDDVWGWFTALGNSTTITYTPTGGVFDPVLTLFLGTPGNCGVNMASLACADNGIGGDPETITYATTPGTRYRVRVQDYFDSSNYLGNICVYNGAAGPANDNPCGAIVVPVNPTLTCTSVVSGTLVGATNSSQDHCGGTEDDDVWFKFTATGTVHNISLINRAGSTTDLYIAVYAGPCTAPTIGVCSDPESVLVTGFTAGVTYWIQVYSYTATPGQTSTFDVCIGTPPPPPANDEPCAATVVLTNPDQSCTNFATGTVQQATDSGRASTCPGAGGDDDDVWYSFVATSTRHTVSLYNITGSTTDLYHAVWNSPCATGTLRATSCSDPDSSIVTGLVIGSTYFVQVYTWTSTPGQTTDFNICIGTPPPPPSNDLCTGAPNLTVNADLNCGVVRAGTIFSATDQGIDNCTGTEDDDVWYRFTAVGPVHTISLLNIAGSTTDLNHAVYTGGCAGLTLVAGSCSDPNTSTIGGLTPGTQYWVQVYSATAIPDQTSTFNICVGTPPPPPSNNFCATPTALPCGTTNLAGTTVNTVAQTVTIGCSMGDYGVWYSFVGNGQQTTITVSSESYDLELGVASGTCGTLTNMSCNDDPETYTFVTTNGVTYYAYVASWLSGSTTTGTFNISRTCTTITPPPNDEPCTATPLPVNAGCVYTASTNAFANNSVGIPDPGCAGYAGGDVWFTAVVPANGGLQIDTNTNVVTDSGMAIYTAASCSGPFTLIECDDFDSPNGAMSLINAYGLTPGTTLYIRVWEYGNNNNGTFRICATTTTPPCTVGSGIGVSTACPEITAAGVPDPPVIDCLSGTGCVDLQATYLQLGETTSYNIQNISGTPPPYQFDCMRNPVSVNIDDRWSAGINLPFNFCFYGTSYTSCVMGSNGVLSFNTALANTFSGWDTRGHNIPALENTETDNFFGPSIFGVHHDINPAISGKLGWELINLDTGCRALVASWHDVPMFSNSAILYTGMMVLYENTNIIEVFIETKGVVASWNDGNATVGLQNAAGDQASVPLNRNTEDPNWTATNEAWRFVPSGNSITSIKWYQDAISPGNLVGTTDIVNVCPSSTTTYIAEVTYTLCNSATPLKLTDQVVVTVNPSKTWNGSVNTDWDTAANWTPVGVPVITDCILVPPTVPIRNPIISGTQDGLGRNITIKNGASLTINSNGTLTIADRVRVDVGAGFTINDSGSLIQINNGINTGNITMQRNTNIRRQDYVYWATPVNNFPLANVSPLTPANLRFQWNPTLDRPDGPPGPVTATNDYGEWEVAAGNMVTGKGYALRGPSGYDNYTPGIYSASFIGTPNNGPFTVPINRGIYADNLNYTDLGTPITKDDDNWNFIGNPYPSAIDAKAFLTLNTDIVGTVYLWTHGIRINVGADPFYGTYLYNYNISNYLEYNLSGASTQNGFDGFIGAGQGFYVLMDECAAPVAGLCPAPASSTVTFENNMRTNSAGYRNNQFFRTTEEEELLKDRIWLDLVSPSGGTSTTLVAYAEGATNEVDRLYDAKTIGGGGKDLYSILGVENYIIQGRQYPLDTNDQVPLGITTAESGVFNIAIHGVDGLFGTTNQDIYLEDRLLNVVHDLRNAPYTFTLTESGTYNDRFVLRYNDQTLGIGNHQNSGFDIIGINDQIKVTSGNSPINTVIVYDILGRVLADYKNINLLNFDFKLVNQSKGTLIVKATLYNGQQKIKKVIY